MSLRAVFCFYDNDAVSGPGRWVCRMVPRLRATGVEALPLAVTATGEPGPVRRDLEAKGIPVLGVHGGGPSQAHVVHALLATLAGTRPDVIVADHVIPALLATYWTRAVGLPTLVVLRSDDPWYWRLAETFLFGHEACRAHGVVAVSREIARRLGERLPHGVAMMHCPSSAPIPTGRASWRADDFHLVYLGRFDSNQKRILELTEALLAVGASRPWFRATMYGDGPLRAAVEARLDRVSGHRIRYGGVLSSEAVTSTLIGAQGLVLLSAFEGLSSAVQEAMVCGLPVIARRTASGVEGVLIHNETAKLLDADEQLGATVDDIARDRPAWEHLARNARTLAEREFAIDRAVLRWQAFLARLQPLPSTPMLPLPDLAEVEARLATHYEQRPPLDGGQAHLVVRYAADWGATLDQYVRAPEQPPEQRRAVLQQALARNLLSPAALTDLLKEGALPADIRWWLIGRGAAAGLVAGDRVMATLQDEAAPWALRQGLLHRVAEGVDAKPALIAQIAATLARTGDLDDPKTRYHRASLWRLAGEAARATEGFSSLLANPAASELHAGCHFHLGELAQRAGRLREAATHAKACLAVCPDHRRAQQLLAEAGVDGNAPPGA